MFSLVHSVEDGLRKYRRLFIRKFGMFLDTQGLVLLPEIEASQPLLSDWGPALQG